MSITYPTNPLGQTLKGLLHQRKKEALQKGLGEVPDLIFHRESGQVIKQNYIRRVFKRILKKAELREIRIHDLRHTFASLLLSQGESPVYVKEQLGHSGIQITVDIYGHLIPGENKGAVNKLDDEPICTLSAPTYQKSNNYLQLKDLVPKARLELAQAFAH
ncbi:MAG: tyrosine-type recombinase/integrase [Desulfobacteria bacterium]